MHMFFVLFFAFFIRLINLNQSLWLDEAVVAKVVQTIPLFRIPFEFSPGDFHPPLYYLFMSVWSTIFGTSEIALRMPSVIFSLIAGWYVYKIGELIKNKTVGLWSAAFFLFNPLIVYYSQEARMYMMVVMLLSVALFYFIQLIKGAESRKLKVKSLIFFNVFSGLAFSTFYGSIFFIFTLIIAALFVIPVTTGIQKNAWIPAFARMTMLMVGLALSGVFLYPLFIKQIQTAQFGLQDVTNWNLVLGKAELKNLAMVFIKFTSGRLSWFPKWSYYLVAGSWSLIIGAILLMSMNRNKVLAFLFTFPLTIGLIISFWFPMMQYFRFLYLIVPMSILLACSVIPVKTGIQKKAWIPVFAGMTERLQKAILKFQGVTHGVVNVAIILCFCIFTFVYLLLPQFHREDWKTAVKAINPVHPVYMILPSSDPVSYYRKDLTLFELRDISTISLPETVQVIPYVSEIYGFNYVLELEKKGCIKESDSTYRGPVILEVWKCLRHA